jgi:hypothetical protein
MKEIFKEQYCEVNKEVIYTLQTAFLINLVKETDAKIGKNSPYGVSQAVKY